MKNKNRVEKYLFFLLVLFLINTLIDLLCYNYLNIQKIEVFFISLVIGYLSYLFLNHIVRCVKKTKKESG